ncbi:MAG: FecR domain-containing protein, partial [Myxococcota bacterium]
RALDRASFVEPEPRRSRHVFAQWAAAGVLLVSGTIYASPLQLPTHGETTTNEREEISVGGRAVAVAEPGSALSWHVDWLGGASVRQERGSVFYRVNPGQTFSVETPPGRVEVLGTCFSVEVESMKETMTNIAIGAAVGTLATVTVYEGWVQAATSRASVEVQAGEQVELLPAMDALEPKMVRVSRRGGADAARIEASQTRSEPDLITQLAEVELPQRLRREIVALERRVQSLNHENERLRKKVDDEAIFEPSEATLAAMAEECELRWDYTAVNSDDPETLSNEIVEGLGLSQSEREIVDQVFARYTQDMSERVRALYTELTGDPNTTGLSVTSMISEITDKTAEVELQRIYKILSYERAGLLEPTNDPSLASPTERLFRLWTGMGDTLEGRLASELGEDTAHAIRAFDNGFGSRIRGSHGCPSE